MTIQYRANTDCIQGAKGEKFYAGVVRDATTGCIVKKGSHCHPTQAIAYRVAKRMVREVLADEVRSHQMNGSWVIRNKATKEVIMETFDARKVAALNTDKYEAVEIQKYLGELNKGA